MTWIHELSRRIGRIRAPLCTAAVVALAACDAANSLDPNTGETLTLDTPALDSLAPAPVGGPSLATAFSGGIPIGTFHLPLSWFGSRYNGALSNISPNGLRSELAAVKARGAKVVLTFTGSPNYYKDAGGHFSLTKWKQRVNRFRGVNIDSYVKDGTVIGHFMIDEPNDPSNWSGRQVSQSTLEEMGRYSKGIWPSMPTIVRVHPDYFTSNPRYVDAAWAQYLYRRGNVADYNRKQVSDAQRRGLALIMGLNVLKGGKPNGTPMSGSEVKSWGSALLSTSYPCAFISWKYSSTYLNQSSVRDAMSSLRRKAQSRGSKTCRGS